MGDRHKYSFGVCIHIRARITPDKRFDANHSTPFV